MKAICLSKQRENVWFSSNKTSSDHQDEEVSISLNKKKNEVQIEIHEVKCIGEEVEHECTSSFLAGDLHITTQDVGSCMDGEKYFGSYPK